VERVHLTSAAKPFIVLEQIPGIAGTAELVHSLHDNIVASVYSNIRLVTRVVAKTLDVGLAAFDDAEPDTPAERP
jgi:hypothetical protein